MSLLLCFALSLLFLQRAACVLGKALRLVLLMASSLAQASVSFHCPQSHCFLKMFLTCIYLFCNACTKQMIICVHVCVHACDGRQACRSQETASRSWFSCSTLWALGLISGRQAGWQAILPAPFIAFFFFLDALCFQTTIPRRNTSSYTQTMQ